MSASVVNLQAQVESVLGALVKAATVELTKLFESRYRGSAVGRTEDKRENEMLERLDTWPPADTKRSIGVQVDEGVYPLSGVSGMCFRSFKCYDFLFTSAVGLRGQMRGEKCGLVARNA